ncbi:hypothetical protein AAEY27_00470 [Kosakonia sp. BYX6]|uniref:Uncharacterized protein n=1 Tax=Kosakonia calanthes TaxID=3139408 RepID=A0ABZ3B4Y6_9ENTR
MTDITNLPSVQDLKLRFQTGRVPLNADYADLITLANIGHTLGGDDIPGNGLVYDTTGRLHLNINNFYSAAWDLSLSSNDVEITINEKVGTDKSQFPKIALLSPEHGGPTAATTTLEGISTVFSLPATKISSNKVITNTTVNIIATKNIGVGSKDYTPLEYVKNATDSWSLCLIFKLDTTTEDFNNCILMVEPLRLAVYKITDFTSTPPQGSFQSIITVYFTYNSVVQIIPPGLIQMYSGSVAPKGWVICDGNNGTPDLRDKFIVMQGSKFTGSGNGNTSTGGTTVTGKVAVGSTTLTEKQLPEHAHSLHTPVQAMPASVSRDYLLHSQDDRTTSVGGGQSHTHSATFSTSSHTHTFDVSPPYYALLLIMKL